jgi:two-component system chemotaxis response regulator CheB
MGNSKIRVLVVDDSFFMRKIISEIISAEPDLEVIDKAKDGREALEKILALKPDVVTMDVNIPGLDGTEVLKEVMLKQPTRVIMLSAYTQPGASATIKALELGAVDFIAKPSGEVSLDLHKLKNEIISKVRLASRIELNKLLFTLKRPPLVEERVEGKPVLIKKIVVIGASTGGPKAILGIMQHIPRDIPAAFLIVQHMPEGFTFSFAERISWQSGIKAKEAEDGDIVLAGKAFIAPAGYHMVLEKQNNKYIVKLNQDALVNFVRPSIDVTLNSVADVFGKGAIAVILSGMGKDGLEGARKIKEKGGLIIVQDEATSVIWGMPKAVFEAGLANKVSPLFRIHETIIEEIKKDAR